MGATHSTWYMGQALQPSDRAHWEGISTGKGKGKSHRARTPAKPSDPGDDAPTESASPEADPG